MLTWKAGLPPGGCRRSCITLGEGGWVQVEPYHLPLTEGIFKHRIFCHTKVTWVDIRNHITGARPLAATARTVTFLASSAISGGSAYGVYGFSYGRILPRKLPGG